MILQYYPFWLYPIKGGIHLDIKKEYLYNIRIGEIYEKDIF